MSGTYPVQLSTLYGRASFLANQYPGYLLFYFRRLDVFIGVLCLKSKLFISGINWIEMHVLV